MGESTLLHLSWKFIISSGNTEQTITQLPETPTHNMVCVCRLTFTVVITRKVARLIIIITLYRAGLL